MMLKIKYKLRDFLDRFSFDNIELSSTGASMTIAYHDDDKKAAWLLYIELLTRITTQELKEDSGDEEAALDSVYSLFGITRNILKEYGRGARLFTVVSILILNQKIRPFTSKWHKIKKEDKLAINKKEFRCDLEKLRVVLVKYTKLLANLAGVEDLTLIDEKIESNLISL